MMEYLQPDLRQIHVQPRTQILVGTPPSSSTGQYYTDYDDGFIGEFDWE